MIWRRGLGWAGGAALVGLAAAWALTSPPAPDPALAGLKGDPARGEPIFWASGCASCHTAPDSEIGDAPVLSGGRRFATAFGTFVAPNISPSPAGIGDWTDAEILRAVRQGVSPDDEHLYPAFPWRAYSLAEPQDMADLVAFLRTLPPSDAASAPHELSFPFNIRRALGVWRLLAGEPAWVGPAATPESERGRYIAEAMAHCGECHTPRNALGVPDTARWMGGAPNPSGDGRIPNVTPAVLDWSQADIAAYLRTGFTPDYDSAGGEMVHVIRNMGHLAESETDAIAAYVSGLSPVEPATD